MPRSLPVLVAVLCGCVPALLAQAEPEAPAAQDCIELHNGSKLEGRIVAEDEQSLTIRLGPGQELTLPKKSVASFVRHGGKGQQDAAPSWPEGLGPRDDWFRLRDAQGRVVGTLQLVARAERGGTFSHEEYWLLFESSFGDVRILLERQGGDFERRVEREEERRATRLVRIERVDAKLTPLSCYLREQLVDLDRDRTVYERVFDAEISHGRLRFKDQSTQGKDRDAIPFPAGSRLPLLVREQLRRGAAHGAEAFHASVFDPLEERFELRRFRLDEASPVPASFVREAAPRPGRARLVEWKSDGRTHREWISAEGQILRIECNGVHLIAEPVSEEYARALKSPEAERRVPSQQAFGELELWLPRATWAFGALGAGEQSLTLLSATPGAELLVWKGERDPEHLLVGVAQDVVRRYRLEYEDFESQQQELVQLDGRNALRLHGTRKDAQGREVAVRLWVLATKHVYYVIQGACPARDAERFDEELRDFAEGVRYR